MAESDALVPPDDPFLTVVVPAVLAGERVDRGVAMVSGCTRSEASGLIAVGAVWLDGAVVTKPSQRLDTDGVLILTVDPHRAPEPLRADDTVEFEVVFADDDIIVVDKPAGLVVHPGPGHEGSTLVHGLLARFPDLDPEQGAVVGEAHRPGLVHRLDRGTSGLMVVARTPDAHADLVDQLSTHAVERVYSALVWGNPEHDHVVVDAPIGRSRRNPLRMTVAADGRPARTHVTVDERFDEPRQLALLTCELETGRTHQIRVHLDSIGHPVVGDDLYGPRRDVLPLARPFLHARRLEFVHPGSGEPVAFESPLPPDLSSVLHGLTVADPG